MFADEISCTGTGERARWPGRTGASPWPKKWYLNCHWKNKRVPKKHLFLLYWLCQSFWLCGSQQTVENYERIGIPDDLTCLLRNLYVGQEATVRTGHGTTDPFQIGKGVCQGCILSPCLFNLYAEYIMRNAGLEEAQVESKLPGEISITSDMQMTPPLWQKVKKN